MSLRAAVPADKVEPISYPASYQMVSSLAPLICCFSDISSGSDYSCCASRCQVTTQQQEKGVSMLPRIVMRRLMLALLLGAVSLTSLFAAHPTTAAPRQRCFSETGFCVSGPILSYWERNGG